MSFSSGLNFVYHANSKFAFLVQSGYGFDYTQRIDPAITLKNKSYINHTYMGVGIRYSFKERDNKSPYEFADFVDRNQFKHDSLNAPSIDFVPSMQTLSINMTFDNGKVMHLELDQEESDSNFVYMSGFIKNDNNKNNIALKIPHNRIDKLNIEEIGTNGNSCTPYYMDLIWTGQSGLNSQLRKNMPTTFENIGFQEVINKGKTDMYQVSGSYTDKEGKKTEFQANSDPIGLLVIAAVVVVSSVVAYTDTSDYSPCENETKYKIKNCDGVLKYNDTNDCYHCIEEPISKND